MKRDVGVFHFYNSAYMGTLLQQRNLIKTKKCILIAVVMWEGGYSAVGKESLIEQTNE